MGAIQKYVSGLDPNIEAKPYNPEFDVPYESVEDYILTLRTCCRKESSHFAWPVEGLSFQKAFTVALHHLPPGCMISIKNSHPLPDKLFKRRAELREGSGGRPSSQRRNAVNIA